MRDREERFLSSYFRYEVQCHRSSAFFEAEEGSLICGLSLNASWILLANFETGRRHGERGDSCPSSSSLSSAGDSMSMASCSLAPIPPKSAVLCLHTVLTTRGEIDLCR